jgi:hypothetical protein
MNLPAVFIVGAPRTGSTILYQALTNSLLVTYPDNLTSKFGRHLRSGLRVSRLFFGETPHNCFTSVRGRTDDCGLHAPNEMEHLFKGFFPQHGAKGEAQSAVRLSKLLKDVLTAYRKPVIFKSLRVGQRIELLTRTIPFARFIHIRRNPLFTIQSIILARAAEGKPPETVWYVTPRRNTLLAELHGVRKVVHQVRLIDEEITDDLSRLPGIGMSVWYEDLCRDAATVTQRISAFLGDIPMRPQHRRPNLSYSDTQQVDSATFRELRRAVEELGDTWRT